MLSPSCLQIEGYGLLFPPLSGIGLAYQELGLLLETNLARAPVLDFGRFLPFLRKLTSPRCKPLLVLYPFLYRKSECLDASLARERAGLVVADPRLVRGAGLAAEKSPVVEGTLIDAEGWGNPKPP